MHPESQGGLFEFDDLKPATCLAGTYNIDRDPPITHTMIYLGRETNEQASHDRIERRSHLRRQTALGRQRFRFQNAAPTQKRGRQNQPGVCRLWTDPGLK